MAKAKKAKDVKTGPGQLEKPFTTEVSEDSRDRSVRRQSGSRPAPARQRKRDVRYSIEKFIGFEKSKRSE
jgi:hypothetical protein